MERFKHKYRIPSTRLPTWNYLSEGLYFITICTKDREHYFGEIKEDKICLNELGLITKTEWMKTPDIRSDMNLALEEFVVMPNHFHGIIFIGENEFNTARFFPNTQKCKRPGKFGPQSKNLGSVIRGFKSSVTTYARKLNINFGWQERFHDHIIRSNDEYLQISQYIINNPVNWKNDKFHK